MSGRVGVNLCAVRYMHTRAEKEPVASGKQSGTIHINENDIKEIWVIIENWIDDLITFLR